MLQSKWDSQANRLLLLLCEESQSSQRSHEARAGQQDSPSTQPARHAEEELWRGSQSQQMGWLEDSSYVWHSGVKVAVLIFL